MRGMISYCIDGLFTPRKVKFCPPSLYVFLTYRHRAGFDAVQSFGLAHFDVQTLRGHRQGTCVYFIYTFPRNYSIQLLL